MLALVLVLVFLLCMVVSRFHPDFVSRFRDAAEENGFSRMGSASGFCAIHGPRCDGGPAEEAGGGALREELRAYMGLRPHQVLQWRLPNSALPRQIHR